MTHKKLAKALQDPASATYLDLSVKNAAELEGIEGLTALTHLHLNLKLDALPDALFALPSLEALHIKGKTLASIPSSIARLSKLKELDVSSNRLTELPAAIGELTQLRELRAASNGLTTLPDLSGCSELAIVDLRKNALTELPATLAGLPITRLVVADNKIARLPDLEEWSSLEELELEKNPKIDLAGLAPLPKLRTLSLAACKLTALPASLFECAELEFLTLAKNPLGALPPEIGKLTKLRSLYAWECKLESIPEAIGALEQLTLLEIERNALSTLPEGIGALSNLRALHIEKNRFVDLPAAVFELAGLTKLVAHDNAIRLLPDQLTRLTALEYLRLENNPVERFPEDLSPLSALTTFYVGLNVSIEELQSQVTALPPQAFIMSYEIGDIARDGRWSSEPAPAASDGAELHIFHHENRATDAVFIEGGVASVGYDGLRVFDRKSGEERFAISKVSTIAASPSGTELLLADGRGQVSLVDARTGDSVKTYDVPGPVGTVGFTHDGQSIFVSGPSEIVFIDRNSGAEQTRLKAERVSFVTLSPDDATVAFGCKRAVHLVHRSSGKESARVVIDKRQVNAAAFGPDGDFVVAAGVDPGFVVFDPSKKKPKKVRCDGPEPTAMDLSPDGSRVVTGERDYSVRVWNRETGELLQTLEGHAAEGPIDGVRFNADGTEVASAACDKTIRIWRV